MEDNKVSRTALMMAYIRAYHAAHDAPKIFDDFLAHHFLPDEAVTYIEQFLANSLHSLDPARAALCPDKETALAWVMRSMGASFILSRARYTEDALEEAVTQGVRQYVILGAGMDTFAFRRPEMLEQLRVFEVDHPATQNYKCSRIAGLGWQQPAQLHFVPVDFTRENLTAALKRSPFDTEALSFCSWLGVTYYLPCEAVFATLGAFADAAPAGSTIVFDYFHRDAFDPERVSKRKQWGINAARQEGEPPVTGFDPSALAAELADLGLGLQENLSPADIQERYFRGRADGYYASEHVHFALAVVK